MQNVRIVNVKTGVPINIETEAGTFGELVNQLLELDAFVGYDFNKCHCFVKAESIEGSKKSIGLAHETLPDDETYTLYVTPAQMKGGSNDLDLYDLRTDIRNVMEVLEGILSDVNDEINGVDEDDDDDYDDEEEEREPLTEEEEDDLEELRSRL